MSSRARALLARLRARGADAIDLAAHAVADGQPIDVEFVGFDGQQRQLVLRHALRALHRGYAPGSGIAKFRTAAAGHPDFDHQPRACVAPAALLDAIAERILPSPHD